MNVDHIDTYYILHIFENIFDNIMKSYHECWSNVYIPFEYLFENIMNITMKNREKQKQQKNCFLPTLCNKNKVSRE